MIKCKQCGGIKVETEYRKYYGEGERGFYRVCKTCESINNRLKYLNRKPKLSADEEAERSEIEALYELLRLNGHSPPAKREVSTARSMALQMMEMQRAQAEAVSDAVAGLPVDTPPELLEWLRNDISDLEEWELQDILDGLEDKFRPQIGVDPESFKPIYNEENTEVIAKIAERFDV